MLRLWGMPSSVIALLGDQWLHHERYATFGGAVHPVAMRGCCSLPQGDVFSPLALAALLAAPLRQQQHDFPRVGQMLYLDDRTILGASVEEVRQVQTAWETFSALTRLKTHPGKTQLWGRTQEAKMRLVQEPNFKDCGEVLGAIDGPGDEHPKEKSRKTSTSQRAKKILQVPGSQRYRQQLAASLLTPHAVWGILTTNRSCKPETYKDFAKAFREAVKGGESRGDRSARNLQKVFLLGHTSDLAFVACTRLMNAIRRWTRARSRQGLPAPDLHAESQPLLRTLGQMLETWNWRPAGWGRWQGPSGTFDVRCSLQESLKSLHQVRTDWRLKQIQLWTNMKRIDAVIARNLQFGEATIEKLRKIAKQTCCDGIAVMCGGAWSPAVERFGDNRGVIHHTCPYCLNMVVPDLDHIFWTCDSFAHCRSIGPPNNSPLARRLGWDDVLGEKQCLLLINQMAAIRRAEVRLRLRSGQEAR
eukprot:Skav223403  [mRNA]  locus=scaffold1855:5282:6700:- [translate_table: standard]